MSSMAYSYLLVKTLFGSFKNTYVKHYCDVYVYICVNIFVYIYTYIVYMCILCKFLYNIELWKYTKTDNLP